MQVSQARALYDKHYALQVKEVDFPTNDSFAGKGVTNLSHKGSMVTLYAERPPRSRLFARIKHYRCGQMRASFESVWDGCECGVRKSICFSVQIKGTHACGSLTSTYTWR